MAFSQCQESQCPAHEFFGFTSRHVLQNCNQVIVTESPRYLAGNVSIMVATRKAFRRVKIGPLRLVSKGRLSMARWIRENLPGLAEAWAAPYTSVFFVE